MMALVLSAPAGEEFKSRVFHGRVGLVWGLHTHQTDEDTLLRMPPKVITSTQCGRLRPICDIRRPDLAAAKLTLEREHSHLKEAPLRMAHLGG